mmetsp:Transcript_16617/g.55383  ORF Transcript_16617/g.55383 Transcript_16617/m.55383 type:complete len:222 (+) Transcript_16617:939-1604(+)
MSRSYRSSRSLPSSSTFTLRASTSTSVHLVENLSWSLSCGATARASSSAEHKSARLRRTEGSVTSLADFCRIWMTRLPRCRENLSHSTPRAFTASHSSSLTDLIAARPLTPIPSEYDLMDDRADARGSPRLSTSVTSYRSLFCSSRCAARRPAGPAPTITTCCLPAAASLCITSSCLVFLAPDKPEGSTARLESLRHADEGNLSAEDCCVNEREREEKEEA